MPRDFELARYRNVGIMAHIDAGKTTLTERILFYTGRIHAMGEVHHGNTTTDSSPIEQKMGITISSAATTAHWTVRDGLFADVPYRLNLIDTPGHVDFTIEVERSLRVLDGAVAVFDAARGVEAQTETVWRQADAHRVPRIGFVNKMDRPGADFAMCLRSLRERLGVVAIALQLPLGEGGEHRGVIDLVRDRAFVFAEGDGRSFETCAVPDSHRAVTDRARLALVEACADVDADVMQAYLTHGIAGVTPDDLERAIRTATRSAAFVPLLCGAAYRNKGVQMLLDAIVKYLPSPADLPPVVGTDPRNGASVQRAATDDAAFCGLAFKVVSDRFGALTYVRIYAGSVATGDTVSNPRRGTRERVGRLLRMHADEREEIREAFAGQIVAVVGLGETRTGDTLCDPARPVALEPLHVPDPVMELAIEPKTRVDQDRVGLALQRLVAEDPTFRVGTDRETGQTLLRGMGELHLAIKVERLRTEFGVETRTGDPAVAYRETLRGEAMVDYRHVRQTGGPGQFAHVVLAVAPGARGSDLVFVDETQGGVIPREFVPAVEKGIRGAMSRGVLAGYPVVDVHVRLLNGSAHSNDSNAQAFEVAASLAFQQAAKRAGVDLLEPVMGVEVIVPDAFVGDVIGNLHARRGEITGMVARGNAQVVSALVPLASMFGYVTDLRGRTQGRGTVSMAPAHLAIVPPAIAAGLGTASA